MKESFKPASVTLRQVAEVADVHVSTVSRALDPAKESLVNAETRERVQQVAQQLGYRPHLIASQLRRGQTHTVGVIVPDLANPLYAPLVRGVIHALDHSGYVPLVADTQDEHERFRRTVLHLWHRQVDAIISTAPRTADRGVLEESMAHGIPVILAVRTLPDSDMPAVLHDDETGGRLVAEHLIGLGHRYLVQFQGPADVTPFVDRSRGFSEAVRAAGLELQVFPVVATHATIDEGRRLCEALLQEPGHLPTGIFAQNDLLALGALQALRTAGLRCPEDVSVVGYNDSFYAAHARPSLTTVHLPDYEIGKLAGTMAVEYVEHPDGVQVPPPTAPVLRVRESTGPCREQ